MNIEHKTNKYNNNAFDSHHLNSEERLSLCVREIYRNAVEHNATRLFIGGFITFEGDKYFCVYNNADPFADREELIDCLQPSRGGEKGFYGSGMKYVKFLFTEKPEDAKLIVFNRNKKDFFAIESSIKHINIPDIKENDKFANYINDLLSSKLNKEYNVLFAYKCTQNKLLNFDLKTIPFYFDELTMNDKVEIRSFANSGKEGLEAYLRKDGGINKQGTKTQVRQTILHKNNSTKKEISVLTN